MRDDHELRPVGELAQCLREATDVALVERRIDLVEDAKGRRPDAEDRQQERGRGQRALPTGELGEAADPLPGWPCVDIDSGFFRVVAGPQRSLAAAEEALEEHPELAVDRLKRRAELLRDRRCEIVSKRTQVDHGALEIALLRRKKLMTLTDLEALQPTGPVSIIL